MLPRRPFPALIFWKYIFAGLTVPLPGPPGHCPGRQGGRPGLDGLPLLSPAVPHSRRGGRGSVPGAPPALASTEASEQQLGLDSRLNMEPQPHAAPHLQAEGPKLYR